MMALTLKSCVKFNRGCTLSRLQCFFLCSLHHSCPTFTADLLTLGYNVNFKIVSRSAGFRFIKNPPFELFW
eukprot:UN20550